MKQIYVKWSSRQELRSIKVLLDDHGFKGHLPKDYSFPIVVVDTIDKEYFGTNTTCMAALASSGKCYITEAGKLNTALVSI